MQPWCLDLKEIDCSTMHLKKFVANTLVYIDITYYYTLDWKNTYVEVTFSGRVECYIC